MSDHPDTMRRMDEIVLNPTQLARLTEYGEVTVYAPETRTYIRLKIRSTPNDHPANNPDPC